MTRPLHPRRPTAHRRVCSIAVVAVVLLQGCAIASEDVPRDIPVLQQTELGVDAGSQGGEAAGTARIYLLTPVDAGQAQTIGAVPRDVDESPTNLLSALLAGPNDDELDAQYRTALPAGTELRSAVLRGGILIVDMTPTLLELSGDTLVSAIAQIVFTASEVTGVRGVRILVDGADRQWPSGDGELQARPLSVYDFPGLLSSAQPAYPAIPTPQA